MKNAQISGFEFSCKYLESAIRSSMCEVKDKFPWLSIHWLKGKQDVIDQYFIVDLITSVKRKLLFLIYIPIKNYNDMLLNTLLTKSLYEILYFQNYSTTLLDTLHYTTLHYTTLHYTTLHNTTLHYTTLHYTTLHDTARSKKLCLPCNHNIKAKNY